MPGYDRAVPVRLHRLTSRLGTELAELTPVHLQALCDLRMPEGVDVDFKREDAYTTSGPGGLDELAKDVTALANACGGLIIIGIVEDSQGCAESLSDVAVSDNKIGQMYNGLRARVVPYLPDVWIRNLETAAGSGTGYVLIAVPGSALAPHAVRMTSRPQYSFARRVGRTTAWLEESEIAALYRDRFRLAEEHRDRVLKVMQLGSEWTRRLRPATADRIWLEVALVPSVPHSDTQLAAERAAADARLKEELAHADAELAEEHRIAREREQWAEAYAVEVTAAQMSPEAWGSRITTEPGTPIACPAAIVVNRGHYAITDVYAQFRAGTGGLLAYGRTEHFSSWWNLAGEIKSGVTGPERNLSPTTLSPANAGLRFSEDAKAVRYLAGSYPIIRWRDRWGTRWENKQGVVRQVADGEDWKE